MTSDPAATTTGIQRTPSARRLSHPPIAPATPLNSASSIHIPTALSAPLDLNLGPGARFLPAAELEARYRDLGAQTDDVAVYCGSGVTACHDILAIVAAGLPEPMLYPGSWSDWSTAGMQVETGP